MILDVFTCVSMCLCVCTPGFHSSCSCPDYWAVPMSLVLFLEPSVVGKVILSAVESSPGWRG